MYIEQLDYSVTVPSVNGLETANFFGEHPVYGTVGYPTYEDACENTHGILGFGQFLDSVESMINTGFVGDNYVFNAENMLVEVRNDYECWTWTPETGLVYDPEPEPEYPNRKSRRAIRIERNKQKKGSDRGHGKHARDVRKAIREDTADWDDMPNNTYFRWDEKRKTFTSPKMPKVHRVKRTFRDRMDTATNDRLNDISPVERLTASVLAEVNQYHGYMGYTWAVMALVDELHKVYQYDLPDYAYVCRTNKKNISLVLEYEEYDKNWEEPYTRNVYVDLLHLA